MELLYELDLSMKLSEAVQKQLKTEAEALVSRQLDGNRKIFT
jgi:hypothetical protein